MLFFILYQNMFIFILHKNMCFFLFYTKAHLLGNNSLELALRGNFSLYENSNSNKY